jgi:hypothetical protein
VVVARLGVGEVHLVLVVDLVDLVRAGLGEEPERAVELLVLGLHWAGAQGAVVVARGHHGDLDALDQLGELFHVVGLGSHWDSPCFDTASRFTPRAS